ncbi:MAG: DUF2723 domain-containing protein [Acidobacteriota bacterium]
MATRSDNRWTEWIAGSAVVLLMLLTYLVTMYPGLGGGGDAAKFRYLGHVLGTAHPSGYPLYILVSWLFSVLPFGTLAYRINLMSAVFGALTAGATYLSVRSMGGARAAAIAAGIGLGCGRLFWSKAGLAEVYTLAGFLTAATIAALLTWRQTGRPAWLIGAVTCASMAFGNHLTVMFAVPAFIAFALLTDAKTCLRPRMLIACAAIVALGMAQYGFIILRTVQHAPYLESRATTLSELWDVLTARRYASDIFTFDWAALITERLPALLSMIRQELTVVGLVFLGVGMVWLGRTRWRELCLFGLGVVGIAVVTLNVSADSEGFVVPAFAFLWPVVGVGIGAALGWAGAARWRRLATGLVLALATLMPAWEVAANYALNNHANRVFEDIYFASLFEILPRRTIIPAEEYSIDQHVFYQLLGAESARGRDIRHVHLDVPQIRNFASLGYDVFAFAAARRVLEGHGLVFEPVRLLGQTLSDYLDAVRPGWIVAVAGTPAALAQVPMPVSRSLGRLGAVSAGPGAPGVALGLIGVSGARAGSAVSLATGSSRIDVAAGSGIGSTGTTATIEMNVTADGSGAVVSAGGRDVMRTASGVIVVVMTANGRVVDAEQVDTAQAWRVPIDMRLLPVSRATFAGSCEDLGNTGWTDVSSSLSSGAVIARIDNYRAFDASMIIYATSDTRLAPAITAVAGTGTPALLTDVYDTTDAAQASALDRRVEADGLDDRVKHRRERWTVRISIRVNDGGDYSTTTVNLGRGLAFGLARARVDLNNPKRATLCSVPGPQ